MTSTTAPKPLSLCARLARCVRCTRRRAHAAQTNVGPADACVFEPRIDVLEKLVADLRRTVERTAQEGATQSANVARVMDLIESLRAEHAHLTASVGRWEPQKPAPSQPESPPPAPPQPAPPQPAPPQPPAPAEPVTRPTLMMPPPPLQRVGANHDFESPSSSSPVFIPRVNPLAQFRRAAAEAQVETTSPAWFPVSAPAAESTAYHDAYSSDEDDRSAAAGGPRMLDA